LSLIIWLDTMTCLMFFCYLQVVMFFMEVLLRKYAVIMGCRFIVEILCV